jgi:thiol-disulfide isomerase/thioredoxin
MRLFAIALCAALALPAAAEEEIAIGLPAPSFSLRAMNPDVAGTGWLALDKFAGEAPEDDAAKLVVLSFFASWCGPCKKEMPFLVQLDQMYREQGLRIVGICIDTEEPGIAAAKKMIGDNKVTYPVVSDRFNFLARRYLGESAPLPSVFLVRRDGNIARIERGYSKDVSAFLLAAIQQELGLKVTAPPPVAADAKKKADHRAESKADEKADDGAELKVRKKPAAKPAGKDAPKDAAKDPAKGPSSDAAKVGDGGGHEPAAEPAPTAKSSRPAAATVADPRN